MQSFTLGTEEHSPDLSIEDLDQRDQDYRTDLDHNQRPSNIIMLRMLPPNATATEVSIFSNILTIIYIIIYTII